jgi:hypothetical protein
MKKLIITVIVLIGLLIFLNDFTRTGKLEVFFDEHPNPSLNSKVEYVLALLTDLSNKKVSAELRYRRIVALYPDQSVTASAWANMIEILDNQGDQKRVMEEAQKFVEKYPDDERAELLKKKMSIIQHGF